MLNIFLSSDISLNYTRNFTCYAKLIGFGNKQLGNKPASKTNVHRVFMRACYQNSDIKFDNTERQCARNVAEAFFSFQENFYGEASTLLIHSMSFLDKSFGVVIAH